MGGGTEERRIVWKVIKANHISHGFIKCHKLQWRKWETGTGVCTFITFQVWEWADLHPFFSCGAARCVFCLWRKCCSFLCLSLLPQAAGFDICLKCTFPQQTVLGKKRKEWNLITYNRLPKTAESNLYWRIIWYPLPYSLCSVWKVSVGSSLEISVAQGKRMEQSLCFISFSE